MSLNLSGWMTAELFIKLAAQMYGEQKDHPDSDSASAISDTPNSSSSDKISSASSDFLREHRESNGGVKVKSSSDSDDLIDLDLALDLEDPDIVDPEGEVKTQQWLPNMSSKFWAKYVNKLRVNSSEEGVCDLAERDEDPNEDDVRRRL